MTVKEEVRTGLKNAIAHGESIEKAVESFVNAGYNQEEVHQAANELRNQGAMGITGKMNSPIQKPEKNEKLAHKEKKILGKLVLFTTLIIIFLILIGIALWVFVP